MPQYIIVDNSGEIHDEIFDSAQDAEAHLEKAVKDGDIEVSDIDDYEVFELEAKTLEVEVTVDVTIS